MKIFNPEFLDAVKRVASLANEGNKEAMREIDYLADNFFEAMGTLLGMLCEKDIFSGTDYAPQRFVDALFGFRMDVAMRRFMRDMLPVWKAMQAAKEKAPDGKPLPDASKDDMINYLLEVAPAYAFMEGTEEDASVLFEAILCRFYGWRKLETWEISREFPQAYNAMREAFFAAYLGKEPYNE